MKRRIRWIKCSFLEHISKTLESIDESTFQRIISEATGTFSVQSSPTVEPDEAHQLIQEVNI